MNKMMLTEKEKHEFFARAEAFIKTEGMSDEELDVLGTPIHNVYYVTHKIMFPKRGEPVLLFAGQESRWEFLLRMHGIMPEGMEKDLENYLFIPIEDDRRKCCGCLKEKENDR